MNPNDTQQKTYLRSFVIVTVAVVFLTIVQIIKDHKHGNELDKMSELVNEMNALLINSDARQLIILKRIKHDYENSNKGIYMLNEVIKIYEDNVLSSLNDDKTPESVRSALRHSLQCFPPSCELSTLSRKESRVSE